MVKATRYYCDGPLLSTCPHVRSVDYDQVVHANKVQAEVIAELRVRLDEAEKLILRMAGEGYQRATFYVEEYDLTGERAADSASVERLRNGERGFRSSALAHQAADEIESLRSRLADLEAERALIVARAENAERAVGEFEHVGWQYRFPSIWGGHVWLDSANDYNGSRCDQAREIFTKVTADDAHLSRKEQP